jgi:acetyl esterase/lipase
MVTARAEYRVRSRHEVNADKCVEDARSAMRWLRASAGTLGVDPDRIVAAGGSAGGHLAVATSLVEGLDAEGEDRTVSPRPNLLVLFNPVMKTTDPKTIEMAGGEDVGKTICPIVHIRKDMPPAIMFFGDEDWYAGLAREFVSKARPMGLKTEFWIAEGQKHGFFNAPPWRDETLYRADEFLARHGYLKGKPTIEVVTLQMKKA